MPLTKLLHLIAAACSVAIATIAAAQPAEPGQAPAPAAADWTVGDAVAEYRRLYNKLWEGGSAQEVREAGEQLQAWLQRVDAAKLDLGEHEYMRILPTYRSAETRADAVGEIKTYIERYERFPEDAAIKSALLDRVLAQAIHAWMDEGRPEMVRRAAGAAAEIYPTPLAAYAFCLQPYVGSETPAHRDLVIDLVADALQHSAMSRDDKWALLEMVTTHAPGRPEVKPADPAARGKAPDAVPFVRFTGPLLVDEGEAARELNLDDFRGKVVLIDFWATWCGPCLTEMPSLVKLHEAHKQEGLQIVGVTLDNADAEDKIRTVMARLGMTWPQVYDGGGWQARPAVINNVRAIPETILLDRNGVARYRGLRGEKLDARVRELLAEQPQAGQPEQPQPAPLSRPASGETPPSRSRPQPR